MTEAILKRRMLPSAVLLLSTLAIAPSAILAHESRPIYIELKETSPQHYTLQWKTPRSAALLGVPDVSLPESCCHKSPVTSEFSAPDGAVRRSTYFCSQGLARGYVTISYAGPNPSISSLVRYTAANGQHHVGVLGPAESRWTIPETETTAGVALQYSKLGLEHIWHGFDHLLFLVCLLLMAGTWRRVLIMITGFTIAHSLTLILSALQLIRMPLPPVEASIALSIVFLASDMVKGPRDSLTWRQPIAVSSLFGLLHGFGFAAILAEIGLPQTEIAAGLLSFNFGVEVGQLLFVIGAVGLIRAARRVLGRWGRFNSPQAFRVAVGYGIGPIASLWLIQRCTEFL